MESWNSAPDRFMIPAVRRFDKSLARPSARPAPRQPADAEETRAMPTVKFVNEKKTIEVPKGANLRKEALKAGIELYPGIHKVFNCHGLRQCASCRVLLKKGTENVSRQGII